LRYGTALSSALLGVLYSVRTPQAAHPYMYGVFRSVTEFYGGIVFLPLYQARKPENTPRPLFLIDENFNLNHAIKIPFLKTKRVEQNEGFS